jgi:glycolate oxidase FAD binding subunit
MKEMAVATHKPLTVDQVQAAVRVSERVLPRGNGTKPALSAPRADVTLLDLSGLAGIVEYDPEEFTFTALAGTRVADVADLLAEHGQYLPFDPPLAEHGATLGGSLAAGLSGPERYRYGGLRDFILGVRYVDGEGQVVYAGGKVVKNSAGFDIPKLMVGSLGTLGVLVELTFKVFPRPEAHASLQLDCARLEDALAGLGRLYGSQLDINALDLEPNPAGATLWVRLGGSAGALPARLERLRSLLGGGEVFQGPREADLWRNAREFAWVPEGWSLIKVPLTPRRIAELEERIKDPKGPTDSSGPLPASIRRYSAGGQVAWLAASAPPKTMDTFLSALELSGLVLSGPAGPIRLGVRAGEPFARRVKMALDPIGRFVEA